MRFWFGSCVALLCMACPTMVTPPLTSVSPPSLEQAHLLYQPTADASGLLGRAVSLRPDGTWIMADERAPGCSVTEREVISSWTREYEEDLGNVAFASAEASRLAQLRADYGQHLRARGTIRNLRVLKADLSGPCGEQVITSVQIGTGTRELFYRRESSAGAGVGAGSVGVRAGVQGWQRSRERLDWDQEQAWAFTLAQMTEAPNIRLGIDMPAELQDGDQYTIEVLAPRQVWLIALCEEADGRASVLIPNREHPALVIPAGQRRVLPAMQATLRDARSEAREKIVLYAFTSQEEYEDFRPPAGAISSEEATRYHRGLPERLSKLPRRRWGRGEMTYLIQPKKSGSQ